MYILVLSLVFCVCDKGFFAEKNFFFFLFYIYNIYFDNIIYNK